MPLTAGEVVFAIDEDHIESVPDATAISNLGITATAAELNILDGATLSVAELNILDGVTASAAELNILDGATLTVTELNYVDGVTSAIQTQLDTKAPATPTVNAQTGTTYSLQASDNGKIVTLSNASGITVTVPSGLGAGFHCQCIQIGAGQVTFSPSSTTVNNRQSHTKIAGQYGVVGLSAYASDVFALAGDTAA